jgi:purine/pyrimidine-nucleoside phosphorylase
MAGETAKQFDKVSVVCKANVFFEGKVISHTVLFPDGSKKTLGLMYPGSYTFKTGAPERMDIISGNCKSRLTGQTDWASFEESTFFRVPGHSSFDIKVDSGVMEYICSFE